jgi:hypothetical protein
LAGLVLTSFFLFKAFTAPPNVAPSTKPSVATQAKLRTKPIEEIQLGERVAGKNPIRDEVDESLPDPDPNTWRTVKLEMPKANGSLLKIELLRPLEWFEEHQAEVGKTIFLSMPEMGAVGLAKVTYLGPCPTIQPPPGNVVTGRFIHKSDGNLLKLKLNGSEEVITVTKDHLFWSEDKRKFSPTRELVCGETLKTTVGNRKIESITPSTTLCQLVFNFEVFPEHVFEVGSLGVLVHNRCIYWNATTARWHNGTTNSFAKPPTLTARPGTSGTNLIRDSEAQINGSTVSINSGHGFDQPHHNFAGSGLMRDQVEQAILQHLSTHLNTGGAVPAAGSGPALTQTFTLGTHSISYRVVQLTSGEIRVTTYWR